MTRVSMRFVRIALAGLFGALIVSASRSQA